MATPNQTVDSSFVNPIGSFGLIDRHPWSYITVAGEQSPGVIPPDGIKGFDRATGWDIKKGKGSANPTITLVEYPPATGSIDFVLWEQFHFLQWKQFSLKLKFDKEKKQGKTSAYDIHHPSLADLNITSCVTKKVSPIYFVGNGKYVVTVEFLEWRPPPPQKDISDTPSKSDPNNPANLPGIPPDSIGAEKDRMIGNLAEQAGLSGSPSPVPGNSYGRTER